MEQLENLKEYLKRNESVRRGFKSHQLSREEVAQLMAEVVAPSLEDIRKELMSYFRSKISLFVLKAHIIVEEFSSNFFFEIRIDEVAGVAFTISTVFPSTKKSLQIYQKRISFLELESFSADMVVQLFTEIFAKRDELTNLAIKEREISNLGRI